MLNRDQLFRYLLEQKKVSKEEVESILKNELSPDQGSSESNQPLVTNIAHDMTCYEHNSQKELEQKLKDKSERFGKYVLLQELGRGGSGTVFKAYDESMKRFVAIKLLNIRSKTAIERFNKEALIIGHMSHPNITPVYETGDIDGKHFIAMQYIDGTTLDEATAHLSLTKTLELFLKACNAIEYAHNQGVMHRDIKPNNIIVDSSYNLYVLDFEMAKEVDSLKTTKDELAGTPSYMSPEQIRKEHVDERTDIYSLGCALYRCITGYTPFDVKPP